MGKDFWDPLLALMAERLVKARTIDAVDLERIIVTDSAEEAGRRITEVAKRKFNLTYGSRIKRRFLLGERKPA
jgi:predicted Rossmann-fold nucleotide-binding protein